MTSAKAKALAWAFALLIFAYPLGYWHDVVLLTVGGTPLPFEWLSLAAKAGVYVAAVALFVKKWEAYSHSYTPLILLLIWAGLSAVWSGQMVETLYHATVFGGTTLVGIVLGQQAYYKDGLRWAFVIISVLSVVALLLLPQVAIAYSYNVGAWRGIFADKNSFGIFNAVLGVFFFSQLVQRPRSYDAIGLVFALLFLVMSGSRSAMAAFAAAVGVGVALGLFKRNAVMPKARLVLLAGAGMSVLFVGVMSILFLTNLGGPYYGLDDLLTLVGRVGIWEQVIERIGQRPLLGYGYNGFWRSPTEGPAAGLVTRREDWPITTHNGFIEVAAELGLVGLGLALVVLGQAVWHSFRVWRAQGVWFPLLIWVAYMTLNMAWSMLAENIYMWVLLIAVCLPSIEEASVLPEGEADTATG